MKQLNDECRLKSSLEARSGLSTLDATEFVTFSSSTGEGILSRRQLDSTSCCVLDSETEVFFWVGSKSSTLLRKISEALLVRKIYPSTKREWNVGVTRVREHIEPEIFKCYFGDWDEDRIRKANFVESKPTFARSMASSKLKEKQNDNSQRIDINSIYSPAPTGKYSPEEEHFVEGLFRDANLLLRSMQSFLFNRETKRFQKLDEWTIEGGREKCHLWSAECYVFVCIYNKASERDDLDEDGSENKEDEIQVENECVTYVWQGRHHPRPSMGLLTFQFQFRPIISKIVQSVSGGSMESKEVTLEQEKESLAFMAHFDRECIIHNGRRPKQLPSTFKTTNSSSSTKGLFSNAVNISVNVANVELYHLRSDPRYKVLRAIQTAPMIQSLCTRDIYLLTYAGVNGDEPFNADNCFLWVGRGASKDEERRSISIATRIIQFRSPIGLGSKSQLTTSRDRLTIANTTIQHSQLPFQIIRERTEPRQFWTYLGPSFTRPPTSFTVPQGQGYYYSIPPPRLFRCSTENGYFEVIDKGFQFSVADLKQDSVCLLDSGPGLGRPHMLYGWVGRDASDVVIKMAKKATDSYFDHLNDGRSLDRSDWDTSDRNQKRIHERRRTGSLVGRSDVVVVNQDQETSEFRSLFHGWGEPFHVDAGGAQLLKLSKEDLTHLLDVVNAIHRRKSEPSNEFLRVQQQDKEEARRTKLLETTATTEQPGQQAGPMVDPTHQVRPRTIL